MTLAFRSHTPDPISIPDPGGRIVTYESFAHPRLRLLRMTIDGIDVLVERWPDSIIPHPAAVEHARQWLDRMRHLSIAGVAS